MKKILNSLASTPEGMKKLLCTYYALKSENADKNSLKKYLKNSSSHIASLELKGKEIKHMGELINIFSFDTFKNVYLNKDSITPYRKIYSKFDAKPAEWHLSKLSQNDYAYGVRIAPPNSNFLWVTSANAETLNPCKLGLDNLSERDVVGIVFPEDMYTLYYPTIIEGYGAFQEGWHYGNIDSKDIWGKAINIESIDNNCTESDIRGESEALLKAATFAKKHKIVALKKDNNTKQYYSDQYLVFLDKIHNEFYSNDILKYLTQELS